jgi:hypothetical protein
MAAEGRRRRRRLWLVPAQSRPKAAAMADAPARRRWQARLTSYFPASLLTYSTYFRPLHRTPTRTQRGARRALQHGRVLARAARAGQVRRIRQPAARDDRPNEVTCICCVALDARFGVKKRGGASDLRTQLARQHLPVPHLSQLSSPRGRAPPRAAPRRPPRARAYIFTYRLPSVRTMVNLKLRLRLLHTWSSTSSF